MELKSMAWYILYTQSKALLTEVSNILFLCVFVATLDFFVVGANIKQVRAVSVSIFNNINQSTVPHGTCVSRVS